MKACELSHILQHHECSNDKDWCSSIWVQWCRDPKWVMNIVKSPPPPPPPSTLCPMDPVADEYAAVINIASLLLHLFYIIIWI
ncbi:hypothetical protein E2C01_001723 [Portunus trituberculatus]|uniref:Uncharacterized protein n=1 Tax=Portunus trituberculatus TaxID=210409 RepID=A0A5B7CIC1_PORTR|nr:hypothetical protein [Portunus trituberculatus]